MSRRWLLSLLCLSVLFLSLVQLTRARGEFKVDETTSKILLDKNPAELLLSVENSTGETLNATIEVELLDPQNRTKAKTSQAQSIATGSQKLRLSLPLMFSNLDEKARSEFPWYRLRYRVVENGPTGNTIAQGIVSFSEITPDLFDLRIATSELAHEGSHYFARVQASHPITRRPAANVQIDGELTIENDDDDKSVKLRASKTTDSKGYAVLDFPIPPLFPRFPYNMRSDDGELHITGKKGAVVAEATGEVMVDQFARILVSSDKPLYQPGQVMHLRALFFNPSNRAIANQNTIIRICDPDGTTVFRTIATTSRFGIANTDWSIPENTRLGDYRVWVGLEGGDESGEVGHDVRISRYDLPNFSVNVDADRAYYLPGQNAEVKVRADYLFGQPVKRGHVRVVREAEREWNYREQKWEVEEGETFEGETDANGVFVVHINLASTQEKLDEYSRFEDITYAAYFTDPTTNRTEQRRFDLRVTKDPIHVYIVEKDEWIKNPSLPLKFYVSTFYADGTPARCKVNVAVSDQSSKAGRSLATVRTNRYGLAKVSEVRLPRQFEEESEAELVISAVDSNGLKGSGEREISFSEEPVVRVETEKALYRLGEPVTAFISSSVADQTVVVDVLRDSIVIRSQQVKLHDGRGSVVFAYKPEFKGKLTIAVYGDFPESQGEVGTHTILYPRDPELKVNVRTSQASYRPGEDARVDLSVRSPEGRLTESALGVVVLDKAVEERFRTAQEFGSRSLGVNDSFQRFLGLEEQVAGVSLRDLQRLDTSKTVSPELDLLADVLLSQSRGYFPRFYGGDQYEHDQEKMFGDAMKQQLKPMREALASRYERTLEYPNDEQSLRRLLSESKIDFNSFTDPWGMTYRASFSVSQNNDNLTLVSAGPDKRFDSSDDFSADNMGWPYFRPMGQAIDSAVRKYHDRTGSFIRDSATLRDELSRDGLNLGQVRDRWGKPYRFEFDVDKSNYEIKVRSGGPDGRFSKDNYLDDDFIIWTSSIDYFEKIRLQIDLALNQHSQSTKKLPATEQELRAVLQNSEGALEKIRDPWNRPYYVTFKTETFNLDHVRIESRANSGESAKPRTAITPVTQTVRFIVLRSMGPDGKAETFDDFSVATFTGVISEQSIGNSEPQAAISRVVFSGNTGAIYGVVTDPTGAVITGATVTARQPDERQTYQTTTREDGKYGLINLPPGMYEVRFEATGFMVYVVTNVLVRPSNAMDLSVSLSLGTVTETVNVTSGAENNFTFSVNGSRSTLGRNVNLVTKSGSSQQLSTPRLREYFPETLVWQPSIETDKQGRAQINFKLADNITTWKMVVLGSTEDGQLGIAEKEIKAFQPFFVEHDPPRVLTEGDEISLPVTVRNFLERPQKVDLDIKPENWFSLSGPAHKRVDISAGDATRETFDLRAIASIKDGKQRITAIGSEDSDAIEKPVTVHPDGEERSVTAGDIIADRSVLELNLPETMIPNSKRAELKIYPNLMAHVIESVEGIMQRPYGCGEQTISSTYPSLLLLRHYKQSGESSPVRARAERYVKEGYSRLLNYRDESGGFTYWGHGQPDLALTAYALRFLTAASDVISVDPEVIKAARQWLINQQQADGSWAQPGHGILLTAYVTRILAQVPSEQSEPLKRAVDYVGKKAGEIDEPYLLASYALAAIGVGDIARARPAIEKLRRSSLLEGNANFWSLRTNTPFHGWGRTGEVETTALVTQALAKYCDSQTTDCEADKKLINAALLFLLKEKDRYGVWYSTQATINVLDAMLTLFAKNSAVRNSSGETTVLVNGSLAQTVQIPVADRLNNPITLDITQFLNPGANRIEFRRASGLPLATVQAVANFYVPWSDPTASNNGLRLRVKFDKTEGRINEEITCNVETERVGSRGYGMLLAEIGLPPGAEVDRSTLEAALKDSSINQYDVLPDRVVVYLWPRDGGVKFNFKFRPRFGLNAKTAPSLVYDYYNPESRAVVAPATFRVR